MGNLAIVQLKSSDTDVVFDGSSVNTISFSGVSAVADFALANDFDSSIQATKTLISPKPLPPATANSAKFDRFAIRQSDSAWGFITRDGGIRMSAGTRENTSSHVNKYAGPQTLNYMACNQVKVYIPAIEAGEAKCKELFIMSEYVCAWLDNGDIWTWGPVPGLFHPDGLTGEVTKVLSNVSEVWWGSGSGTTNSYISTNYLEKERHYFRLDNGDIWTCGASIALRGGGSIASNSGSTSQLMTMPTGYVYSDVVNICSNGGKYGTTWLIMSDGKAYTSGHNGTRNGAYNLSEAAGIVEGTRNSWVLFQHLNDEVIIDVQHKCGSSNVSQEDLYVTGGTALVYTASGNVYGMGLYLFPNHPELLHANIKPTEHVVLIGDRYESAVVKWEENKAAFQWKGRATHSNIGCGQRYITLTDWTDLSFPAPVKRAFESNGDIPTSEALRFRMLICLGADDSVWLPITNVTGSRACLGVDDDIAISESARCSFDNDVKDVNIINNQHTIIGTNSGAIWAAGVDVRANFRSLPLEIAQHTSQLHPRRIY